jgi:hypothetical protein
VPQAVGPQTVEDGGRTAPDLADYPVREYVAGMAAELAGMARWDGDEALAAALEAAAQMARQTAPAAR